MPKQYDLKMFRHKLYNVCNFYPVEVMDRSGETQLQVKEILKN